MSNKQYSIPNVGIHFVELPETCPMCGTAIVPNIIIIVRNKDLFSDGAHNFSAALACPSCHKLFVAEITDTLDGRTDCYSLLSVAPKYPTVREFDPAMSEISSQFVEIYHQAEAAEAYNLDQIAGIAYRKALEFLVKDYAILFHSDQSDRIKETRLAKCIENYIDHPKIQATAKAATWIGNDETHYIRKWDKLDIEDLKKFISACVYWILSDYAYREADQMTTS